MLSIFKSRTFWTLVAVFVVGGGNAIVPMIPEGLQAIIVAVLAMLATYFHVNPSQEYNTGSIRRR